MASRQMPGRPRKIPSYCRHKASGQAVVRIGGKDEYLGPYGSPESYEKYHRLLAERFPNGPNPNGSPQPAAIAALPGDVTIVELMDAYWGHVQGYYLKNGDPQEVWPGGKSGRAGPFDGQRDADLRRGELRLGSTDHERNGLTELTRSRSAENHEAGTEKMEENIACDRYEDLCSSLEDLQTEFEYAARQAPLFYYDWIGTPDKPLSREAWEAFQRGTL